MCLFIDIRMGTSTVTTKKIKFIRIEPLLEISFREILPKNWYQEPLKMKRTDNIKKRGKIRSASQIAKCSLSTTEKFFESSPMETTLKISYIC